MVSTFKTGFLTNKGMRAHISKSITMRQVVRNVLVTILLEYNILILDLNNVLIMVANNIK